MSGVLFVTYCKEGGAGGHLSRLQGVEAMPMPCGFDGSSEI